MRAALPPSLYTCLQASAWRLQGRRCLKLLLGARAAVRRTCSFSCLLPPIKILTDASPPPPADDPWSPSHASEKLGGGSSSTSSWGGSAADGAPPPDGSACSPAKRPRSASGRMPSHGCRVPGCTNQLQPGYGLVSCGPGMQCPSQPPSTVTTQQTRRPPIHLLLLLPTPPLPVEISNLQYMLPRPTAEHRRSG